MTDPDRGHFLCFSERIRASAGRSPDACAVRDGDAVLTYRDLDARADRLAARIAGETPPRSVVAIWMKRSFEHIVAALATARAGCAYVWLEPGDPAERVRAMIQGAAIPLVLTDRDRARALEGGGAKLLIVDRRDAETAPMPVHRPVGPDDLAYVAFTSGTTGRPKGAMVTHANLASLIEWHVGAFQVTAADCASHLAGLSFDASAWEIWPYLATGACVTLVDDTTRTAPGLLADWFTRERVTIAFVPTALAGPLMRGEWADDCALRRMLVGGEALRTWPRAGLPFAVFNNYGVAECSVVSTSGLVPPETVATAAGVPSIGRPIGGTWIELLDEAGRPVRRGEEGEIWIGGAGVGQGYLNEPEMTAAVFADAPEHGGRRYRTGDRGRLLPGGEISHLGRRDDQCKIRGVRIETEEVALALRSHPDVADVAIVAEDDAALGKRLAAYVVPVAAADPGADELRAFLARALPANYIPARFAMLASLPLTANGKVDKAALAAAPGPGRTGDRALVEPANPIESRLLGIMQDVLRRADISTEDDFFLLGGHSLLATQTVLRTRDAFGIDLLLHDLFEAPTIQALARTVEQRIAASIATMPIAEVEAMLSGAPA